MPLNSKRENRSALVLSLLGLGLITALIVIPSYFISSANSKKTRGSGLRTESHETEVPNYDIREDKAATEKIERFRTGSGKNAVAVADIRDRFVDGEKQLASRVPTLKIEYNTDIRIPEVIGPDVKQGRAFLTGPSSAKRSTILLDFLRDNTSLTGVNSTQVGQLKVAADYTNPDGNLSFVELNQEISGIPVFRGEAKAGFTKKGEMIRVINNLAAGLDYNSLSTDFRDPVDAIKAAAAYIKYAGDLDLKLNAAESTSIKSVYGTGTVATTAEKMYFPTEAGVAVAAWRVLIWEPVRAYYVIVDAENGTLLWRKNLTEDQTQSATYNVYINPSNMMNTGQSPYPLSPGPIDPALNTQGSPISRTMITLIGNEAPFTFNNLGWITDGNNTTDGNNVQAGLDRKLPNTGSPANPNDLDPDGVAVGTARTFDFPFVPGDPNTNTGDSPLPAGQLPTTCLAAADASLPTDYQKAITTQLFYIVNRYHDQLYLLGFNEPARNFQNTNFAGLGGLGNDRVSAQAQDCSGSSNANFTTPADGGRPTMQMYLWPGPTPDFDGSIDADIVIHEHTHGLSNRLHGNASGLSTNMSRGMGEGWSDFYAHSLLGNPTDPVQGIYTLSGYATYRGTATFTSNYYYGIRRYPKDVIAHTGGVNNKPHNAYTFKHVNSNCNTFFNNTNFAFVRSPAFGSSTCDQVHNLGEIWSTALWEARANFVTRMGYVAGNQRMLQLVTDGMKLAPLGPTFLSERDAIIAAAIAGGSSPDVGDLWAGFALRGMGFSATIQNAGTGANNTAVTEAFDLPNVLQTPSFTVSDAPGDNDGVPEPGENITLNIPLTNNTGTPATGVTLQVVGGGSANYGTIASGTTVSQPVSFTVPVATPCGSALTLTFNVNSNLGPTSFNRSIIIGAPSVTFTQNFDGVTAPALPAGWTATPVAGGTNFVNTTNGPDTAPNVMYALDPTTVGGGSDLTSPSIPITAPAALVSFRHKYDTEPGWDGGLMEISINGGTFQDVITAGGAFIQNGYDATLGVNTAGNSPLGGRPAWTGNSAGYKTSIVRLPAAAAGQNVQIKWRFGADDNTTGAGANPGWYVDTIQVFGAYTCSLTQAGNPRADFDNDGKTDFSVFRSTDTNWYTYASTAGVQITSFGNGTDTPVPGDYDDDGKADIAMFRQSTGEWFVLNSSNSTVSSLTFGLPGDKPVAGDYDGDGKTDQAVYRPSGGLWAVFKSSDSTVLLAQWGNATDVPVPGDYDGDTKTDFGVYRNGDWYVFQSTAGPLIANWGVASDKPIPADYDGDNKDDLAIYRPSQGLWAIYRSSDNTPLLAAWGNATDVPVPGDYDGDNKDDFAVFRNGNWYVFQSTGGPLIAAWGAAGDTAIPAKYIP